jgi:hypothetical protein
VLEYEADMTVCHGGGGYVLAAQQYGAAVLKFEARDDAQERCLARTRGAE